ncbi:hypothetical protein NVIRPANT_00342 [Pantoea sp. Nvir]|nr:hypothetical protein NVIRPANT_00342 [Pantoea sp. Nvir]
MEAEAVQRLQHSRSHQSASKRARCYLKIAAVPCFSDEKKYNLVINYSNHDGYYLVLLTQEYAVRINISTYVEMQHMLNTPTNDNHNQFLK